MSGGFYPKKSKHYASYNTKTFIYNPTAGTWSNGPARLNDDYGYEENWVKLPDGSILSRPRRGRPRWLPRNGSCRDHPLRLADGSPRPICRPRLHMPPAMLSRRWDRRSCFPTGKSGRSAATT